MTKYRVLYTSDLSNTGDEAYKFTSCEISSAEEALSFAIQKRKEGCTEIDFEVIRPPRKLDVLNGSEEYRRGFDAGVEHGMIKVTQETEEHVAEQETEEVVETILAKCTIWKRTSSKFDFSKHSYAEHAPITKYFIGEVKVGDCYHKIRACARCGMLYFDHV